MDLQNITIWSFMLASHQGCEIPEALKTVVLGKEADIKKATAEMLDDIEQELCDFGYDIPDNPLANLDFSSAKIDRAELARPLNLDFSSAKIDRAELARPLNLDPSHGSDRSVLPIGQNLNLEKRATEMLDYLEEINDRDRSFYIVQIYPSLNDKELEDN